MLCFSWGLVLVCHVWLSPQLYFEISVAFANVMTFILLIKRFYFASQGEIHISANNAFLQSEKGCYRIEFIQFNGWRLLAKLTLDSASEQTEKSWREQIQISALMNRLKQAVFLPTYLSVYHSMLNKDDYAYLRSFAAYQCHMPKEKR